IQGQWSCSGVLVGGEHRRAACVCVAEYGDADSAHLHYTGVPPRVLYRSRSEVLDTELVERFDGVRQAAVVEVHHMIVSEPDSNRRLDEGLGEAFFAAFQVDLAGIA